eukprot:1143942-Pelagomonas_calceolata.AAC.7
MSCCAVDASLSPAQISKLLWEQKRNKGVAFVAQGRNGNWLIYIMLPKVKQRMAITCAHTTCVTQVLHGKEENSTGILRVWRTRKKMRRPASKHASKQTQPPALLQAHLMLWQTAGL